jgi:(S)-mandelate dehydrogenase
MESKLSSFGQDADFRANNNAVADSFLRAYPTWQELRCRAKSRLPNFSFEFLDGGAGSDQNIAHNFSSLDAVELMPRYGIANSLPSSEINLFGQRFSVPLGISPIGSPSIVLPGAEIHLAQAAQKMRIPYMLGVLSNLQIEDASAIAGDVLWYQIYRFPKDNHRIGFDLLERAGSAGVKAIVLTIDTPIRTIRTREVKAGLVSPFKISLRLGLDALTSPTWIKAWAKYGRPRFAALNKYFPRTDMTSEEISIFLRREMTGAFSWDEIARYRDVWKGTLILKGILHPLDAERARSLGVDGLVVSNHGGRQIESLPASIDALPAIRAAVGDDMTVLFDSGIRSGVDIVRAMACGANAVFSGKGFLWSLGALAEKGPEHFIRLCSNEFRATLGQLGCESVDDIRRVEFRHRRAWV